MDRPEVCKLEDRIWNCIFGSGVEDWFEDYNDWWARRSYEGTDPETRICDEMMITLSRMLRDEDGG